MNNFKSGDLVHFSQIKDFASGDNIKDVIAVVLDDRPDNEATGIFADIVFDDAPLPGNILITKQALQEIHQYDRVKEGIRPASKENSPFQTLDIRKAMMSKVSGIQFIVYSKTENLKKLGETRHNKTIIKS